MEYSIVRIVATATLALVSVSGFGPSAADVRAQLIGQPPDVGIAIATLDDGKTLVQSVGSTFDGDSRFEIGSITKTFTATLFADMIVRHEVASNDPIEKYLPAGTKAPQFQRHSITLADLATQSSGLPRMPTNFTSANSDDPYDYDDGKLRQFLNTYALTRAPGQRFEYSNLGFGLLGYLLARRLGLDYATAVRTRVLEPLGMKDTDVAVFGRSESTVPGHDSDGDPVSNWHFAALAGAGAIVSTPNDMLRYARANLDTSRGPLAAAMALAQHPLRPADGTRRIGYAWLTNADGIVWHNGGTGGFRSFLGIDKMHHRAIFVVANAFLDAVDGLGFHALDPARPLPSPPAADATVERNVLEGYVGRYTFTDKSVATVTIDDRGLAITFDKPAFHARLHPRSQTEFAIPSVAVAARFARAGHDTTLTILQDGQPSQIGTRKP